MKGSIFFIRCCCFVTWPCLRVAQYSVSCSSLSRYARLTSCYLLAACSSGTQKWSWPRANFSDYCVTQSESNRLRLSQTQKQEGMYVFYYAPDFAQVATLIALIARWGCCYCDRWECYSLLSSCDYGLSGYFHLLLSHHPVHQATSFYDLRRRLSFDWVRAGRSVYSTFPIYPVSVRNWIRSATVLCLLQSVAAWAPPFELCSWQSFDGLRRPC